MFQNKKLLVIAGLAAFAYYKYSSMSPEAKKKLTNNIKEKAKSLFDEYIPEQARDFFKSPESASTSNDYGATV